MEDKKDLAKSIEYILNRWSQSDLEDLGELFYVGDRMSTLLDGILFDLNNELELEEKTEGKN